MPRLSGSTAEFLSMWSIMMAGAKPFSLDSDTSEWILRLALAYFVPLMLANTRPLTHSLPHPLTPSNTPSNTLPNTLQYIFQYTH